MEAMRFGCVLQLILNKVLTTNPLLGPVYLRKVDLSNDHMRLWMRMEDVLSVAFLILKNNTRDKHLVVFHLSLPMGYIDSAPYFCMETEILAELSNETIALREQMDKHPLELSAKARASDYNIAPADKGGASWENLPAEQHSAAKENVDVYLYDFISVIQG